MPASRVDDGTLSRQGDLAAECEMAKWASPQRPILMPSRRRVEYDDDLLVELIARGELSLNEIAGRLGISHTTVSRIVRGKARADLQPKIHTAMQQSVHEVRKLAAQSGHQEVQGPRGQPGGRKKQYDEQALVDLLAGGDLSYAKIAEKIGSSSLLRMKCS